MSIRLQWAQGLLCEWEHLDSGFNCGFVNLWMCKGSWFGTLKWAYGVSGHWPLSDLLNS